jgi:hypothetical protein
MVRYRDRFCCSWYVGSDKVGTWWQRFLVLVKLPCSLKYGERYHWSPYRKKNNSDKIFSNQNWSPYRKKFRTKSFRTKLKKNFVRPSLSPSEAVQSIFSFSVPNWELSKYESFFWIHIQMKSRLRTAFMVDRNQGDPMSLWKHRPKSSRAPFLQILMHNLNSGKSN